jgi:hypothetical protein
LNQTICASSGRRKVVSFRYWKVKMTDVFIRNYIPDNITGTIRHFRRAMETVCLDRWSIQAEAMIYTEPINLTLPGIKAKKYAEEKSITNIYISADDDCLIIGKDFVSAGLAIMEANPEYGILGATSISDGHFQTTVSGGMLVIPMHAVGGVVFVRKGILKEFPDCDADKVDDTICQEINRAGYKTGLMPGVKFNHLGAGYSITSKGNWSA